MSHAPVSEIISKLEEIAKVVNFTVRHKGCLVSLHGTRESVEGPLVVTVEIFELIPLLLVVELKRKGGDRGEYEELYMLQGIKARITGFGDGGIFQCFTYSSIIL